MGGASFISPSISRQRGEPVSPPKLARQRRVEDTRGISRNLSGISQDSPTVEVIIGARTFFSDLLPLQDGLPDPDGHPDNPTF